MGGALDQDMNWIWFVYGFMGQVALGKLDRLLFHDGPPHSLNGVRGYFHIAANIKPEQLRGRRNCDV